MLVSLTRLSHLTGWKAHLAVHLLHASKPHFTLLFGCLESSPEEAVHLLVSCCSSAGKPHLTQLFGSPEAAVLKAKLKT